MLKSGKKRAVARVFGVENFVWLFAVVNSVNELKKLPTDINSGSTAFCEQANKMFVTSGS